MGLTLSSDVMPSGALPPSIQAAANIISATYKVGIRHFVYCPGSRGAPFAYVLDALWDVEGFQSHIRLDERSAGFFAVGLSRAGDIQGVPQPVAIITTSGTAVAELHSAVAEARHSHLPLVIISADRPVELRGVGASQTTIQPGIFAEHVIAEWDVDCRDLDSLASVSGQGVRISLGEGQVEPGPVQINVGLRDPLTPLDFTDSGADEIREYVRRVIDAVADNTADNAQSPESQATYTANSIDPSLNTVVIAGDGADESAQVWAERARVPLFAEPMPFARCVRSGSSVLIPHQQAVLSSPDLVRQIQQVIVVGRPTLSRPVTRLINRPDVHTVVVDDPRSVTGLAALADEVIAGLPLSGEVSGFSVEWLSRVHLEGDQARANVAAQLEEWRREGAQTSLLVADDVWKAKGRHLFVGASNPIRALDLVATGEGPMRVMSNRGLAGIDGTIATAIGVATGTGEPVRLLIGDLTFYHDASSLMLSAAGEQPDLQIIVVDDNGGTIFATLEHGQAQESLYDRWFATRQCVKIEALAEAYGAIYRQVSVAELAEELEKPYRGINIVHVKAHSRPDDYAQMKRVNGVKSA